MAAAESLSLAGDRFKAGVSLSDSEAVRCFSAASLADSSFSRRMRAASAGGTYSISEAAISRPSIIIFFFFGAAEEDGSSLAVPPAGLALPSAFFEDAGRAAAGDAGMTAAGDAGRAAAGDDGRAAAGVGGRAAAGDAGTAGGSSGAFDSNCVFERDRLLVLLEDFFFCVPLTGEVVSAPVDAVVDGCAVSSGAGGSAPANGTAAGCASSPGFASGNDTGACGAGSAGFCTGSVVADGAGAG